MPIDTEFRFNQAHPSGVQVEAVVDLLGLLRGLVGREPATQPQRTWRGAGFNMIWRPNFDSEFGTKVFFLELNFTDETLSFTDIGGATGVANRGLLQPGIFLGAAAYLQTINDSFDNSGQHFEPGVWANVPRDDQPQRASDHHAYGLYPARHDRSICRGRRSRFRGGNLRPPSITPFTIGSPDDGHTGLVHFPEETLATPSTSRTDLARVAALTQARAHEPESFPVAGGRQSDDTQHDRAFGKV